MDERSATREVWVIAVFRETGELSLATLSSMAKTLTAPGGVASAELDFDVVYREHRGRVLATVRSVVGASDELEDVVQLVFIEIHRCLPRFEGRAKLSTWLYRIAVNVALQHLRRRKRARWLTLGLTGDEDARRPSGADTIGRLEDREILGRVYAAADKLSEKKRVVWVLHELQGLDPHQIADILEIPMNTVRSRLLAARADVMAELTARGVVPARGGSDEPLR